LNLIVGSWAGVDGVSVFLKDVLFGRAAVQPLCE